MREPSEAPAEFVSYVDRRLRSLEGAGLRLTGDEVQAERLARELLTLVALRWRGLARADSKQELPAGASADVYLSKLFQQEADDFGYPRMILNLNAVPPPRRRTTLTGAMAATDEATYIWEAARGKMRRRLLIAAAIGGVVALAALCRRGGSGTQTQVEQPPLVQTTELPPGAFTVPAGTFELRPVSGIPAELKLPETRPPALSENPIPRVTFLVGSPRLDGGAVYAFAEGIWRHVDFAPEQAGAWMEPTALSPDGRRAVFVTPATTTMVVDLTSGHSIDVPSVTLGAPAPVWLSDQQLLLGKDALLDLATLKLGPAPVGPDDAVTPQRREPDDRTETLIELLPIGQPLTAPNRVRQWALDSEEPQPVTRPANGPLADLLGRWQGPGFGFGDDRIARLCLPGAIPGDLQVSAIVAIISPKTAEILRALLIDTEALGGAGLLGWQDERTLLMSLSKGSGSDGYLQIVAWDLLADRITRVSTFDFVGTLALRDLTRAA